MRFFFFLQVKIWFQNHRYKCKRQAKEKAMAEQNAQNQVRKKNFISKKIGRCIKHSVLKYRTLLLSTILADQIVFFTHRK